MVAMHVNVLVITPRLGGEVIASISAGLGGKARREVGSQNSAAAVTSCRSQTPGGSQAVCPSV